MFKDINAFIIILNHQNQMDLLQYEIDNWYYTQQISLCDEIMKTLCIDTTNKNSYFKNNLNEIQEFNIFQSAKSYYRNLKSKKDKVFLESFISSEYFNLNLWDSVIITSYQSDLNNEAIEALSGDDASRLCPLVLELIKVQNSLLN